jgi:hypothetical protein
MPSPEGDCICAGQRRTRGLGPQFTAGEPEHGRPVRSQHNPYAGDPAGSYAGPQHAPCEARAPFPRRTGARSLYRTPDALPMQARGALPRGAPRRAPGAGTCALPRRDPAISSPRQIPGRPRLRERTRTLASLGVCAGSGRALRRWQTPARTSSGVGAAGLRPGLPRGPRSPCQHPATPASGPGRLRQRADSACFPRSCATSGQPEAGSGTPQRTGSCQEPPSPDRFRRPPAPKVTWITGAKAGSGARTPASSPAPGRRPDAAGRGPRPDRDHLAPGTPPGPRHAPGSAPRQPRLHPSRRAVQTQPLPFRNLCGPSGGASGGRWSRRPPGGVRPPGPSFAVPQSWRPAAY